MLLSLGLEGFFFVCRKTLEKASFMCWSTVFKRKYLHRKRKQGKGRGARRRPRFTLCHQCFRGANAHTPRVWAGPHPHTMSSGEATSRLMAESGKAICFTGHHAKCSHVGLRASVAQRLANVCQRNSEVWSFHPLHWADASSG